jgi:hypothetical protein
MKLFSWGNYGCNEFLELSSGFYAILLDVKTKIHLEILMSYAEFGKSQIFLESRTCITQVKFQDESLF